MVWYLTPNDQILIQDRNSETYDNDIDNKSSRRESLTANDFSIDSEESIMEENKINNSSTSSSAKHTQTLCCSICNTTDKIVTDVESGEIICSNCGVVISDKIEDMSSRSEKRVFSLEAHDRSRTGPPISLARHDKGLATIIGKYDRDASGHKIDTSVRSTMQRLRTWDFRIQSNSTSSDRNLKIAFEFLDTLKDKLRLSDVVIENTAYMYRKAQERGFVRGRSIDSVVSALAYIACRQLGISKTIKDIAAASNLRRKNITRIYRQLLIVELDYYKVPNPDPIKCIAKVANKAKLSEKTKRQALNIMKKVTENEISAGKDPMGMAATVVYISCLKTGEERTQKDISNAAGVTEVTLRNRFKDLKNQLKDIS
jgi:transcription initiation factor TFIIB